MGRHMHRSRPEVVSVEGFTDAHVHCPDPGGEHTGGTALFRITRREA